MYETITTNIMVNNVKETIKFYVENLGFQKVLSVPEDGDILNFAVLSKDKISIMFQEKENLIEEYPTLNIRDIVPTFTLFITVDNVKALYDELKEKVQIAKELHQTFYGQDEFAIFDNNGKGIVNSNIGLISYDEAMYAGGYGNKGNTEYYLRNGYNSWTMSSAGFDPSKNPHEWYIGGGGDIWATPVSGIMYIRPVINLKADIKATGTGSITSPYVVQYKQPIIKTPNIEVSQVESGSNRNVNITYVEGYTNQYSLDLGETWIPYTEPITVTEGTTILARGVDDTGRAVSSSSFKVVESNNSEIREVSKSPIEIPKIQVSMIETNYKVEIIYSDGYTGEYSLDLGQTWQVYTEPFIITEEITILAQSIDNNGNVVSSNSFQITGEGSSEIREVSNSPTDTPNIQINDKIVEITYPDGYNKEYSLDSGETWNSYVESITIEEPTTILARSLNSGNGVVSSSSFKTTTISN